MSEGGLVRVMLVDDHPIVRDGLRDALRLSGEFDVVGVAGDGAEAVRLAGELSPDVVVMDVMMPGQNGIEACREITEMLPGVRVLILTASTEEEAVVEAVSAGATGYLLKDTGRADFLAAVRDVADGRLGIPADALRRAFDLVRSRSWSSPVRGPEVLTPRERLTLRLFSEGKSYAEIARVHGNSPATVRNSIYRIQDRLGVGSRQEMVVWAVRAGLLDDSGP